MVLDVRQPCPSYRNTLYLMASVIVGCHLHSNINWPISSFNTVVTRTVTDDVNMQLLIGGVLFLQVSIHTDLLLVQLSIVNEWTVDGGRWTVDGGRWTVDGGRWTVDGGRWAVGGGRWTVDGGRWTVDGGRWTVDGGRWTVDGGRWTVDGGRWAVGGGRAPTGGPRHSLSLEQQSLSGANGALQACLHRVLYELISRSYGSELLFLEDFYQFVLVSCVLINK